MIFEASYLTTFPTLLIASDEAGRGPLAGPVVAASVALEVESPSQLERVIEGLRSAGVRDSKLLSESLREKLATLPWDKKALCEVSAQEIDELNILRASLEGMRRSAEALLRNWKKGPVVWLVDGNRAPKNAMSDWVVHPVVKGDAKSALIGLASIHAKVHRDQLMRQFELQYPGYGLAQHAGYPTAQHRAAIAALGPSPIHRKSFKGVREYLSRT